MSTTLSFAGQSNKWNTEEDASKVVEAILAHPNLKILDLENNTLGPEAAKVIGEALAKHPEFERAHFKDLFTGRLKTEIPLALKHLFSGINKAGAKLLELDLSDNALGPVGVEGMVEFMCSPACYTLQELRLNNNGLGITGGTMLAKSLEKLLDNSEKAGTPWKLKVFIAGRNRLEKVGAKIYAPIFKRLGSLEELAMPQNGIFHEGIAALAEALSHNPNIKILNLNDNTFTRKGAEAMAKHLPKMQALEIINFGDCLLKSAGATALSVALLPGHLNLKELYLDGNELTAEGGLSVVEAVQNKTKLTKLMLDDNMFGEEGRKVIENFLEDVGKLDVLIPLENDVEPDSDDEEENDDESSSSSDEDSQEENVSVGGPEDNNDSDIEVIDDVRQDFVSIKEDLEKVLIEEPVTAIECTVAEYLSNPSPALLLGLTDSSTQYSGLISQTIQSCKTPDQEIAALTKLLVDIAVLANTTDLKLLERVTDVVRAIGRQIFDTAKEHLLVSYTTNTLLVYLGLIKCEDRSFTVSTERRGILRGLNTLVKEDYFPQDTKNTLRFFLSKQSARLDGYAEKQQLVDSLSN